MEFIKKERLIVVQEETEDQPDLKLKPQDEVTEIMGNPPTWTMRWGVFLIAVITVAGLIMSSVFSYPDIIEAPVYLTTENPPLEIFSRMEGKIEQLLVVDQEYVTENTLLATIENPANYEDVMQVEGFIKEVENNIGKWYQFSSLEIPNELELGSLNSNFSELTQTIRDLQYFLKQEAVFVQIAFMEREIEQIKKLNISLKKQEDIYQEELRLVRKNFERNQKLLNDKLISEMELEKLETEYRAAERQHENMRSGIINNEIKIEQLKVQRQGLKTDRLDQVSEKSLRLQQLIDQAKAAITEWQHNYLIVAPQAGVIQFDEYRQVNQFVPSAAVVFTIIADSTVQRQIIARSEVPMTGSGKITPGSTVNIRLTGFPYREYGSLTTTIDKIASLPVTFESDESAEPGYLMEMSLPDTLLTSYGIFIPFKYNMTGTARIITKDRSFLSRVFEQFLSAVKN